jgi:hypothetical protein
MTKTRNAFLTPLEKGGFRRPHAPRLIDPVKSSASPRQLRTTWCSIIRSGSNGDSPISLWRYPDPEHQDFKQCVLLARRREINTRLLKIKSDLHQEGEEQGAPSDKNLSDSKDRSETKTTQINVTPLNESNTKAIDPTCGMAVFPRPVKRLIIWSSSLRVSSPDCWAKWLTSSPYTLWGVHPIGKAPRWR